MSMRRGGLYVRPIIRATIPYGDDVKVAPTNAGAVVRAACAPTVPLRGMSWYH
jgi:hypothetical protein